MAITVDQFMYALAGQESGYSSNPDITNPDSGAHGHFQIMDVNWPSWAAEAGLGANAPKTSRNQTIVAKYKLQQYYDQTGDWRDVAAMWYSGQPFGVYDPDVPQYSNGNEYPSIREYTDSVLARLDENGPGWAAAISGWAQGDPGGVGMSFPPDPGGGGGGDVPAIWSEPYVLNGRMVQRNTLTGQVVDLGPASASGQTDTELDWANYGLNRESFEYEQQQDAIANQRADAQFKADEAARAAQQLLDQGYFDLAKQKQAEESHWRGVEAQLAAQGQALTARGQDLDYQASMASIDAQRQASHNNYLVGMANATNDAERNAITARWNEEQAAIARMEDETNRILGAMNAQVDQFGAETQRQVGLGQLGLDLNRFILETATSPRNLPSLFMMQRGIAPDWDTIANGGTPATGAPLAPVDVMNQYKPVTPPITPGTPQNSQAGRVGQATGGYVQPANPFIQPTPSQAPGTGGGGAAAPAPWNPAPVQPYTPQPASAPQPASPQASPGGGYIGIPLDSLSQGWNLVTTGSGGDFTTDDLSAGVSIFDTNKNPVSGTVKGGSPYWVYRAAAGTADGYTTEQNLMVGDAAHPNPYWGGAMPEMIENPTGAPIRVIPNAQNLQRLMGYGFMPPQSQPATNPWMSFFQQMLANYGAMPSLQQMPRPQGRDPFSQWLARGETAPASPGQPQAGGSMVDASMNVWNGGGGSLTNSGKPLPEAGIEAPPLPAPQPGNSPPVVGDPYGGYHAPGFPVGGSSSGRPQPYQPNPSQVGRPVYDALNRFRGNTGAPRFAMGTDASAQYAQQGMGGYWISNSDNSWLNGNPTAMPQRLQMLANYGYPVNPALYASATGQIAPTMNFGGAFAERGGGVLPSLQQLGRQTPSEQELYRGYAEGVVGVPWRDLVDQLGRGTASLKTAVQAR